MNKLHELKRLTVFGVALAAALLGGGMTARAQQETVTIGTGTSYARDNGSPFYDYYNYSTTASLYTAVEIGQSGLITEIAYNCQSASAFSNNTVHIYMATLNKTTFSGNNDWPTGYVEVYSSTGFNLASQTGWNTISLATPYYYDKDAGSLAVIITRSGNYKSQYWYYSSASNTYLYRGNDNSSDRADITNTSNGTRSSNRPNIRLTFQKIFYFSATATPTPSVGGTASVSPTTANVQTPYSNTSATTTATFTATANSDYLFNGWSETASGAIVSTNNPYTVTITSTSTNSASPTNTTLFARFEEDTRIEVGATSITANDADVPKGETKSYTDYTLTVANPATQKPHDYVSASSSNTSVATITNNNGSFTITGVAEGTATITITAYGTDNSTAACNTTFTVKVTAPSTGISGNKVILNDYEDHSWSYYSDPDCPVRSLSPADVKITYYGDGIIMTGDANYTASTASSGYVVPGNTNYVGGAKVNVGGEDENTFVYYKTMERGANTQTAYTFSSSSQSAAESRCPYTPIPNPFQVRPTYGGDASSNTADWSGWRGFQCWRLKSVSGGAVYSAASGGSALSTGAVINAGTDIYFAPNSEYGMEVEFEAVWARAYVVKASDGGANSIGDHSSLGYERNFIVLNTTNSSYNFGGTSGKRITNIDRQVTVSNYLPNGNKGQNNDATYIRGAANNYNLTLQANTKFENVAFNMGSNTLTAAGNDLIIGRGCTGTVNLARGMSGDASSAVSYTIRLESGTYNTYAAIDNSAHTYSSTISARSVFGCDYDRAKGDNNKLSVAPSSTCYGGNAAHTFSGSGNRNNITYDWLIKSGKVQGNTAVGDAAADKSIYIGNSISSQNANSIQYCGKRRLTMEGGEIASIAGSVNCYGNNYANYGVNDGTWSVMIRLKGGTVRGSIYGAAAYAGASGDRRFIFTGGTVNGWIAGGANGTQSDGGMTYGASQLYVGGNTSVNSNGSTSVINRAVGGNVFGAGCGYGTSSNSGQVTVGTTVVVADDAYIERGVYGGGSYGFTEATANIYLMGGTVDCKAGGVNGTSYLAAIEGGVYGGACQNKAGTNNIKIYGGTVNGGVYGGCNYSGNVANAITVDVYGTDPATQSNPYAIDMVFGGGNLAAYSGTPVVTVHCPTDEATPISIGELYGGGNNASVTGTNVTIGGGNIIGDVYGGGRQAAVGNGGTSVTVNGGTMRRVFGGNNISGTIAGGDTDNKISVTVNKTGTCAMKIGEVFGGGNQADSRVGNITIGCTGTLTDAHRAVGTDDGATPPSAIGYTLEGIGDVYGGANDATVTGNVTLTINSGIIYRVFGANNTGKKVTGTVTVNIAKNGSSSCPDDWYVGYVYGGGNNAPYGTAGTNYPAVNHTAGKVTYNVYGGGKGSTATVTSNPKVILSGTAQVGGNVFGGGNAAEVKGNTNVMLKN